MNAVMDSSSLISISESCLINIFGSLAAQSRTTFLIPKTVEEESVLTPLRIHRFELNALRIKKAIEEGWIKVAGADAEINEEMNLIASIANNIFFSNGRAIKLMEAGETEALALVRRCKAEILVIDERTTRMLIEKPELLRNFMEKRHGIKIDINKSNLEKFQGLFAGLTIVRSVELLALAFEKSLFGDELHQDMQSLEASLYALKFRGCAVSFQEIESFLKGQ